MKVLQFGQGNFLRTFADVYFETLNQEGLDYQVYVATAIPHENLEAFRRQGNRYHVVLRGSQGGQPVEQVLPVTCLQEVIDPFLEPEAFYALAEDPELKLIVSNTTEAGIQFHSQDSFEGFADITFPAKVTKFLYRRFQAGQPGIYLLPVELIDNNAGELARCVEEYITLWGLPQEFRQWNQRENFYCNTLVDRIVSGYPREEETRRHLENLVGQEDSLLAVGEPFGLWVIERKGDIAQYIPQGTHQIDVVLAEDISYYKRRKVRVLNGSHTNLVAAGLWEGCSTVYDCVGAPKLRAFVLDTLEREIVPFVSQDVAATREFAASVLDRFANPYLNHQLTSILLNSVSKWKARDLPSFQDYFQREGKIPRNLTKGLAYLVELYRRAQRQEDGFVAVLPGREIPLVDEERYLTYFLEGGTVESFLGDETIWGEDLTQYPGLLHTVAGHIATLEGGGSLLCACVSSTRGTMWPSRLARAARCPLATRWPGGPSPRGSLSSNTGKSSAGPPRTSPPGSGCTPTTSAPIWTRVPSITTSSSLSPCRPGRGAFGATRGPGGTWASATRFTSCPQWGA